MSLSEYVATTLPCLTSSRLQPCWGGRVQDMIRRLVETRGGLNKKDRIKNDLAGAYYAGAYNRPNGFIFCFCFLADLSYVGFVLVGDVLDIQRWKTNFTFCFQK